MDIPLLSVQGIGLTGVNSPNFKVCNNAGNIEYMLKVTYSTHAILVLTGGHFLTGVRYLSQLFKPGNFSA